MIYTLARWKLFTAVLVYSPLWVRFPYSVSHTVLMDILRMCKKTFCTWSIRRHFSLGNVMIPTQLPPTEKTSRAASLTILHQKQRGP